METQDRNYDAEGKKYEQNLVNEVAREKNRTRRERYQGCRSQRSVVAQVSPQLQNEPDNAHAKERRNQAQGDRAQAGIAARKLAVKPAIELYADERQIIE